MAQIPKHRQLPNKEQTLFKELLTQYELKQYKKGIKAADSILKKFPNHGETLALKALTLHSSLPYPPTVSSAPKTEEAEAMAKLAVKKDITSHITWHVMGILAKTRKDWDEASKAFAMARKQDNDNIPLIRDCIALFAHTRQYGQAVAARHHHLLLRPQIRSSWLGLVVAHHLNGNPTEAIEVYDAYASTIAKDGASGPEKAQILQYVVKLCIDANMLDDGLRRLEAGLQSRVLSPRGEVTQLKAELLVKLGRLEDAEEVYRSLLDQNPDNLEYYRGYLRTKGYDLSAPLDDETLGKVTAVLDSFVEVFPRSAAPRRLPLDLTSGEVFRERAKKYLISGLEKGVPSLFVDVKGVYVDAKRMEIVGEILEETISQLEKDASLHDDDTIAPPTTLLWAYYYHALHLSHPSHPNPSHSRSLELLDKALVHTPTLPELYMAKAMVLKRAGDALGAAQAMEEARLLDGQDRFLNGKAAKYWLRAGEVKRAEELVAMFTKKDSPPVTDLTDLQCLWFLEEEARAYRRNGNLGLALKRYHALISTFQEYEDDQYDFHTYSMRRMTLNAYIDLMKFEDQLRSHPSYFKAAIEATEIYVQIFDDPSLTEVKLTPEEEAERKKAAKKAQKAEQKAKKAALANSDGKKEDPPVPDEDPEGLQLLKSETPLDDALKAWKPLEKLAARRVETWTTGYEIFIRKKLVLAALKCLLAAYEIEPENARLHSQIINFKRTVDAEKELAEPVKAVIESQFSSLLPSSTTLEEFNKAFGAKHAQSPSHILGAAQGVYEIKKSDPQSSDAADAVMAILDGLTKDGVPPSVSVFERSILLLKQAGASGQTVDEFRQKALRRAPLAKLLEGDDVRKRKRDEAMAVNEETNGTAKTDV